MIGAAHNMLHRLASSSPSTPHARTAPSPEALLDAAAASAAPTVLGATQNVLSRLTHAIPHATPPPAPQTQHPVPDVLREPQAEAYSPIEGPQQRAAEPTGHSQAPMSVSSRGDGSGEGHAITPPRGVARVTRSYPAIPDAVHPPRPVRVSRVHRRPTGTYADNEMAWHTYDDRDPVRSFVLRCWASLLS